MRRTRKLLREALIDLIEEHGFEVVTVGQIAERAMVSRTAFYRHYRDKYHLLEKILEEVESNVAGEAGLPPAPLDAGPDRPPEEWVRIFTHVAEQHRLYRALLGPRGSSWFIARLHAYLAELMAEREDVIGVRERDPDRFDLWNALIAGMIVAALRWWLEHPGKYTARQMAAYCYPATFSLFRKMAQEG